MIKMLYRTRNAVRTLVAALFAVALLASSLLVGVSPAFAQTAANPDWEIPGCPINVMLVLDESGSVVAQGGAQLGYPENIEREMRQGAETFFNALQDTGALAITVEFNRYARVPTQWAGGYLAVTAATQASDSLPYIYDEVNSPNSTADNDRYDPDDYVLIDEDWTNWEETFAVATGISATTNMTASLAVVILDGNPTTRGDGTAYSANFDSNAAASVPEANALKAQGTHIFVVGVSNEVGGINETHLQLISGNDVYPANDLITADYMVISDTATITDSLTTLGADLRAVLEANCTPTAVTLTHQAARSAGLPIVWISALVFSVLLAAGALAVRQKRRTARLD